MSAHNLLQQLFLDACPYCPEVDASATSIAVDRQLCYFKITTTAARALTLDQPTSPGKFCMVSLDVDGGDLTLTVTGSADGCSTFTLNDAGDWLMFYSVEIGTSYYWTVLASRGVVKNSATADTKMMDLRGKTTATSGDNRLIYARYEMAGAGGGGEALRAFSALTAANGTAHGSHLSLNVSDTGYVTGLGAGMRGQLYVTAAVPAGGTYYAALAEMYFDASASIASATAHAILAVHADGNAAAAATCLNAISFKGGASSSGGQMISPGTSMGTVTGTIRVLINGVVAYIPYYSHEGHA
jgi:hypothetical protein